nr:MlaD family protein [Haloechinothrix alba]
MVGALGLVAVLVLVYVAGSAQSGLPWQETSNVEAEFDDVATLEPGSEVRENGVRIGQVSDVFQDEVTVATLQLDGDVPVYKDARAIIADESALANRFVELHRGSEQAGELGNHRIPVDQTVGATDLADLLDVFDKQTRDQMTSALRELGGGAAGHSENLHDLLSAAPDLLEDGGEVTAALASPEAELPALLHNVENLANEFHGREHQISGMVTQLDDTLRAVNVDSTEPLRDTLTELPDTLEDVRTEVSTLDQPLTDARVAVSGMREGTESLGHATPDLRGLLTESIEPLDKIPGVASKATPAVEDLTQTVADLRPLAPRLSEGLLDAAPPLEILAPYSQDIVTFFQRIKSFVSQSVGDGRHVARLGLGFSHLSTVAGGAIEDPTLRRNVYPEPGEVDHNQAESLVESETGGSN